MGANTSTLSFKIDNETKKEFSEVCKKLGITMSGAMVLFATKTARERRIPFDVALEPSYDSVNYNGLNESIKQMKEGKTVVKTLNELEDSGNG